MQAEKTSERLVALVDMDCFYVQVEQRRCPEYLGKPCVVVQYNQWQGGGIIAVNYEARAFGVERRGMRGNEAKKKCPDLHLFSVPVERGKANLTRYREAGAEVLEVMCQFSNCVERASIDEAYIDLTEEVNNRLKENKSFCVTPQQLSTTYVVGWEKKQHLEDISTEFPVEDREAGLSVWLNSSCSVSESDRKLAMAATIVEEMRAAIYQKTTFRCSAGVAHNKVLAKLSCGLHKPNRQTILPQNSIPILYETLPVSKVRSLGGKLGEEVMKKLSIKTMGELSRIKESQLTKFFGEKNGKYLFCLGQGIEREPVTPRQLAKSIGCSKNIEGNTKSCVQHWVKELSEELSERLVKDRETNHRVASLLVVSFRQLRHGSMSRSCSLVTYDNERIAKNVMNVLQKINTAAASSDDWHPLLTHVALSATKFHDTVENSTNHIKSFFMKSSSADVSSEVASKNQEIDPKEPKGSNCDTSSKFASVESESVKDTCSTLPTKISTLTGLKGFFAKKMEEIVSNDSASSFSDVDSSSRSPVKFFDKGTENYSVTEDANLPDHTTELENEKPLVEIFNSNVSNEASNIGSQVDEDEFTYLCDDCKKKIPLQEIEEHTDFHYAQKIAKELQVSKPVSSTVPCTSKEKPAKQNKRKGRPRKSDAIKKPKVSMKPLEFYMK